MIKESLEFFENEVYQFSLQLNGILEEDYREYLENKKSYYEFAIFLIKKEEKQQ